MIQSIIRQLRASAFSWIATALLPLPALLITNPADNAEISCLYLGVACAWLTTQILGFDKFPASGAAWGAKIIAITCAVSANVLLFLVLGLSVGVKSAFPFSLMAIFSAMSAIGLVQWCAMRIRDPIAAIILAAMIAFAAKLAGCVAARVIYGPRFHADGYIDADWHNAKLMISLFWGLTLAMSFGLLLASFSRFSAQRSIGD